MSDNGPSRLAPLPVRLEDLPLSWLLPHPTLAGDALLDAERLSAVVALGADDAEHVQPLVEDLLATAAAELGTPLSLLNVLLSGSQVVAGAHGLPGWLAEVRATPAEWSLCATVVRTGHAYAVPDLGADAMTADNPLCTVDGLRAYAGVPLRTSQGHVLGALCVLDVRPRAFDDEDLAVLARLADQVLQRLQDGSA